MFWRHVPQFAVGILDGLSGILIRSPCHPRLDELEHMFAGHRVGSNQWRQGHIRCFLRATDDHLNVRTKTRLVARHGVQIVQDLQGRREAEPHATILLEPCRFCNRYLA